MNTFTVVQREITSYAMKMVHQAPHKDNFKDRWVMKIGETGVGMKKRRMGIGEKQEDLNGVCIVWIVV